MALRTLARTVLFLCLAPVLGAPSCKLDDGDDDDPETYRATLHYFVKVLANNTTNVNLPLLALSDLSAFETQSGLSQSAGNGMAYVVVRDTGLLPVSGAVIEARNDGGTVTGQVRYHTASGFNGTTSTDTTGQAVILNLAPGRHNIRCTSGRSGNLQVEVEADGATSLNLVTIAAAGDVSLSGVTREFANAGGTPAAAIRVNHVGVGSPFPVDSDGGGGYSTTASIRANNLLLLRLYDVAASGTYVPTYSYVQMGTVNLVQDLNIVTVAERDSTDFKPSDVTLVAGKGILRGVVKEGGSPGVGYTVTAFNEAGSSGVAQVVYGDSTGVPGTGGVPSVTDTAGVFYVYNADPGTVFLRAVKTGSPNKAGTVLAECFADSITFLDGNQLAVADTTNSSVTVSGTVWTFFFGAVNEALVSCQGVTATGSTSFGGTFTLNPMPPNSSLIARTTK